ncbi:hypothetical protein OOZ19_22760 [Saccharopolyspora sp. NFXS83]|uniref:hypothetical protein n=1 Tax=Saccharopolyspora sp. NFXS83 TaxID=2993560 RepID=UPI00224A5741|nr:hypothetical protein [Saccharopolyspora sp. NFXS83]MCX2733072.1 hypothetical protein [Saccharopolyspora sp. NFXS83]
MAGEQVSEAVLRELYQGDPADFVAERDRRLKQARDAGDDRLAAEIKALRKPTTAAWAVNRVSVEQRDRVDELVEVGDELRVAQRDLRGDEIRRLDRRRAELVRDLTEQAADVASRAGKRLGEQARRQVESTFAAAVAEPGSARRVRAGALSGALTYSGFGLDELSVAAMRSAASSRRAHDSGARRGGRRRAHTRVGRSGADRPDADGEGGRSAARAHDTERAARGTGGKRRGGRRTAETPAAESAEEASAGARAEDGAAEPQPRRERADRGSQPERTDRRTRPERTARKPESERVGRKARQEGTDRKARWDRDASERTTERAKTSDSAGRTKRAPRPSTGRGSTADSGVDEASEQLRQAEDELRAAEQERDEQERDRDELRARLDDLSARLRDTTRRVTRARRQRDTARRRYDSLRQRR